MDIEQREAAILGQPQRIAPLSPEQAGEAAFATLARMRAATAAASSATSLAEIPQIVLTMLNHPDLHEHFQALSMFLISKGRLPARDRELAILRITWLWQAPFPFGEHVGVGKLAGLTSDEIERVIIGSSAEGWTECERAILRAAEELFEGALISDETWDVLAAHYDPQQLMEVPMLIGQFTNVSFTLNSIRARMRPGNAGLKAR
jgi:alkylhydroperoxidase family enzyme